MENASLHERPSWGISLEVEAQAQEHVHAHSSDDFEAVSRDQDLAAAHIIMK